MIFRPKQAITRWSEPILCEARDGSFEQVSLSKGLCSCQEFRRVKTCEHLAAAGRWLGKHRDRWVALSGLQKSIRRCDSAMTLAWANILLAGQSEQSLHTHVSRMLFEESRAFSLWIKMRKKELSLTEALEWTATVAKKWELGFLNSPSHFDSWCEGFKQSFARPPPLPLEFGQLLRSAQDPADIYKLYFDIRRDLSLMPRLWDHLDEIAQQTRNERLAIFLKHKPETKYEAMASMELMLGMYDQQAKERHPSNFDGRLFIPRVENAPFIHDMHTGRGKALWVHSFGEAWRTKNFQIGELDARLSGSTIAVLWREKCHAQKGSMKRTDGREWSWLDIQISEKDYLNAYHLEGHFYESVMRRVQRAHPDLDCFTR